jgi:AcrR family transcriptional regulator
MEIIAKKADDGIQDTKNHIINTARKFFSEYSYLGVSMNDIAKKLNITKAALYYHFTGKTDIYERVLNNVFNDLSLTITQASKENTINKKLHKLIKNYLDFGLKEKNLIKTSLLRLSTIDFQITKHIIQSKKQIDNLIKPIIEEALANKKISKKINSKLLTSLLISMMDGVLLESSLLDKKIDSAKIADQIITILFL